LPNKALLNPDSLASSPHFAYVRRQPSGGLVTAMTKFRIAALLAGRNST
jgi:hypothetical protein